MNKLNIYNEFMLVKLSEAIDKTDYKISFEEVMTETLAIIVTLSRNDDELNIEEKTRLIEQNEDELWLQQGAKLVMNYREIF